MPRLTESATLTIFKRPNIAKTHSKLAEFLTNPNQKHLDAANQAIAYCLGTKSTAIKYSGEAYGAHVYFHNPKGEDITFYKASDAAFADHIETRQSSQGYLFMLFRGLINWKVTLQQSVTWLTTEAELLSLSTAAVEIIWWQRFFKAINFNLERDFTLFCDNMQTVRLLRQNIPKLDTKL